LTPAVTPIRRFLRVTRRYAAVVFTIFGCLLEYLFNALTGRTSLLERARVLHRWNARLLRWLGVSYSSQGATPAGGLVVSNHLSYLDILLFSAVASLSPKPKSNPGRESAGSPRWLDAFTSIVPATMARMMSSPR